MKNKILVLFSLLFIIAGCTPTVMVPKEQPILCQPQPITLQCPEEPSHHLKELTKGLPDDKKLAVVLAADKATINSLENELNKAGAKCPR